MSKVSDLPETTALADNDLLYAVETAAGPNGGRKITKANLKTSVAQTPAEIKTAYESNPNTNAYTDAEKTKLAGIEPGATADQIASEVPYSNATSGLSATQVQAAIDEVNAKAQADFRPSIVSGRILQYSGGTARFDGVFFSVLSGDILLDPNITQGEVYVDLDGLVKQTGSSTLAPPYTIVFARFSTDLNNIISLTDERVKNAQNIVRGLVTDVRDIRAGALASAGASGRVSDSMHKHNILTGAASTQNPNQANAEGVSINLARADHVHNIPTAAPITQNTDQTNSDGVSTNFSKSDHVHNIPTAAPITSDADGNNNQGVATTFAKSDHKHNISTAVVVTQNPDQANAAGTSNSVARADHIHNIPTDVVVDIGGANAEGTGTSFARNDHVHKGLHSVKANAGTQRFNDVSLKDGVGASVTDDGSGNFTVDTKRGANELATTIQSGLIVAYTAGKVRILGGPLSIAAGTITVANNIINGRIYVDVDGIVKSNTGASTPSGAIPVAIFTSNATNVTVLTDNRSFLDEAFYPGLVTDIQQLTPDIAAAAGATNKYADAGHVHNVPTDAPITTLTSTTTNAEGTGTSFSRNDHTHAIASGVVSTQNPDQTNAAGTSTNFAKADHIHNIPTATAVGLNTTSTSTQGSSTSFARADHTHAIASGTPSTQNADQTNAAGSSANFAKADHIHNIPTATPTDIGTANAQGVATTFVKSDHVHKGLHSINANAGTQRFGDVALKNGIGTTVTDDGLGNFTYDTVIGPNELFITQGSGLTANYSAGRVRINGTHYNIVAGAITVATGATNGRIYVDVDGLVKSTTATSSPPNTVPLAIYSSSGAAITALADNRTLLNQNLVFGLSTDIPNLNATNAAAAGATNKYADAGHIHTISTGAASTQTPDQTNATGTSANLARADHVHNIPTAVAVTSSTSSTNAQGVATTFSRADHIHAVTVANQEATATADDTATSLTDILMVSMTATPAAGTYLVMWSGSIVNSANGSERTWISLYLNGVQVSATERSIGTSGGAYVPAMTQAIITTPGAQAIELRWRVAGGTSTVHSRRLSLIKLA